MFNFFRLRYSDQRTLAFALVIGALLLYGHSAAVKRETFEPKQYQFRIDLNTATPGELQTLPGIGPVLAEGIIQYRDQHAPIHDFDEILNVRGIGTKKYGAIKDYFTP